MACAFSLNACSNRKLSFQLACIKRVCQKLSLPIIIVKHRHTGALYGCASIVYSTASGPLPLPSLSAGGGLLNLLSVNNRRNISCRGRQILTLISDTSHASPFFIHTRTFSTARSKKSGCYYDVLDLPSTASHSQIKSAFYKLSKCHHPDVSQRPESHKLFTEINEAYEVLGNQTKRRMYDQGAYGKNPRFTGEGDYTKSWRERPDRDWNPPERNERYVYDEEHLRKTYEAIRRASAQSMDDFQRQSYNHMRERQYREKQHYKMYQEAARHKKPRLSLNESLASVLGFITFFVMFSMLINTSWCDNPDSLKRNKPDR